MRVQYPKLRNMAHTASLLTFSLLPKDQAFVFHYDEMARFLLGSAILTMLSILSNVTVRQRNLKVGERICFPRRPLTRTVFEKYVRF